MQAYKVEVVASQLAPALIEREFSATNLSSPMFQLNASVHHQSLHYLVQYVYEAVSQGQEHMMTSSLTRSSSSVAITMMSSCALAGVI